MIFGTPQYMSPEQCLGRPTDHRADIYALGCIFYELLIGQVPFDGDTFMGVLNQHICDPPPPMQSMNPAVDVPVQVQAVIYRCLDKEAGRRPQSMGALREELRVALLDSGQEEIAERLDGGPVLGEPMSVLGLTKRRPEKPAPPPPTPLETDDTLLQARLPKLDEPAAPQPAAVSSNVALASTMEAPQSAPVVRAPALVFDDATELLSHRQPPPQGQAWKLLLGGLLLLLLGGALGLLVMRLMG